VRAERLLLGAVVTLLVAASVAALGRSGVVIPLAGAGPPAIEIHRVDEGRFEPTAGDIVFVLVVGHDARPGETQSRGDALHLIGMNPGAGRATILNIPRDTYVDVGGGMDKINTGHLTGGPVRQAELVGALVGVRVSFVLTTGFTGLAAMVDELGGIDVDVPLPMDDVNSGAVFPQGRVWMDGDSALAFARNRGIPGGDFSRTHNQGTLVLAALAKLRAEEPTPANVFKWLAVLARHTRFDGVTMTELYRLGRVALAIDPSKVGNVTMPGVGARAGVQLVVNPTSAAGPLFADFRDDAIVLS
jgi:polyisoprenyl-teichoic acid--peptidoglycan teichoic acid transferase